MAVLAHPEVDLGERVQAQPRVGVQQQPDLHPVAGGEGQLLQQLAGRGVLPAQRLDHPGELGPQRGEQRTGHELGDPPAPGLALLALDP